MIWSILHTVISHHQIIVAKNYRPEPLYFSVPKILFGTENNNEKVKFLIFSWQKIKAHAALFTDTKLAKMSDWKRNGGTLIKFFGDFCPTIIFSLFFCLFSTHVNWKFVLICTICLECCNYNSINIRWNKILLQVGVILLLNFWPVF